MKDENLVKLRNEFLIKVGVGLLVVILFSFMVVLVSGPKKSNSVQKRLNKKDTFVILYTEKSCDTCKDIKKRLKEDGIDYTELNGSKVYETTEILEGMGLKRDKVIAPSIFYIVDGELYSYIIDVQDVKTYNSFISAYFKE
jgi:glutaredoxin